MADADTPVALVVQRRISDEGFAAFSLWQVKVAERLQSWQGFLDQEVIPPAPPTNVDWTIVQRFANAETARAWLQSEDRSRLTDEVSRYFVGQEDMHLMPDRGTRPKVTASAMVSYHVEPDEEPAFLKWQGRIQAAEARFPGFLRHKIERPVPGVHDDWLIVLAFDSETHMSAWLESPERRTLLEEGRRFGSEARVRRSNYGFDFWFPAQTGPIDRHGIFKRNLLILLVLYPIVFCWGYFISSPLVDKHGVPFWLSLFIGNFASTQLLGWWVAPTAFKFFDWWLPAGTGWRKQALGYATIVAFYAISMAVCAALLGWRT